MDTKSSCAAAASSEVVKAVQSALGEKVTQMPVERLERVARVRERILSLESRGFLRRQEYRSLTAREFERRYSPRLPG